MTTTQTSSDAQRETQMAFVAARRICKASAGDLYFASYFLPKRKRKAVDAVGALCAMIAEAIDLPEKTLAGVRGMREHPVVQTPKSMSLEQLSPEHVGDACEGDTLDARLAMLRDRLDEIYENRLELPAIEGRSPQQHALAAVAETVREFEIDRQWFINFAEGCRTNITTKRHASWPALQEQIGRTAGSVGAMINAILRATHSEANRLAMRLACAMRFTRILADLKRDAARRMFYLPQDELRRFGIGDSDWKPTEKFHVLMKFQMARARRMYREAAVGICWLADDGSRLAVSAAMLAGVALLHEIERDPAIVLRSRVSVSAAQKLLRIPAAVRLARREDGQPLPRVL